MTLYRWSKNAATNGTADPTINYAEGQAPSSLNDSARAAMAAVAKWRDDVSGAIVAGGTSSAFTISSNQGFSSFSDARLSTFTFSAPATNAAAITLNLDGTGPQPINGTDGQPIPAGTILAGGVYQVTAYTAEWVLHAFFGNPYNVPIGACLPYWGTTVPNSSFVFPLGQTLSMTTYASLFALFGTTYNIGGEAAGTFRIPDCRGRVLAQLDVTGGLLTSATITPNGNTLGGLGGQQISQLTTANLPPYTPSGTNSAVGVTVNTTITNVALYNGGGNPGLNGSAVVGMGEGQVQSTGTVPGQSFAGNAQGGTSTAFTNMQPTIMCNYIMRVI